MNALVEMYEDLAHDLVVAFYHDDGCCAVLDDVIDNSPDSGECSCKYRGIFEGIQKALDREFFDSPPSFRHRIHGRTIEVV